MKKIIALLACLILVNSFAFAETDLSGMSFEELLTLQSEVNLALWASEGWQEVTVPVGIYEVGKDIPVGRWTIRAVPTQRSCCFHWGKLEDGKVKTYYGGYERVYGPEYRSFSPEDITELTVNLEKGQHICIEDGDAVFTPYTASFSFK